MYFETVNDGNWNATRRNFQKIESNLFGPVSAPTFGNIALGTGEITLGSVNRASGTLTLEIGGTPEISITSAASTFGGNIVIPDGGNIGSVSDTDAVAIASDGKITLTQDLTVNEDIIIGDGKYIGSASDPDAIQIEADGDIVMSQDLAISGTLGVTGTSTLAAVGCGAVTGTSTAVFEGASVTVGKASTTTGTLVLHDSNSANTITLTVPDISAGSLTFTLPPTDGDNTNLLQTNGSGVLTWVASPSTSPGGNDTEVQYNNGGSFGGDATFNFNDTTKVLDVDGLTITGTIATGLDMSGGTFATANINLAANPIIQAAGTTIAVFDNTNKNMFFGELAGDNSPGEANVFIGYEAGRYNETTAALDGDKNVYIGYQVGKGPAGNKNLAYLNVGIGYQCLFNSKDGSGNVAIGDRCLYNCVDGESNTGIGQQALYNNVTGNYNVGLGYQAGRGITGTHSIAVGYNSLLGATGSQNTAIGGRAGSGLGTGGGNVFIGYYSCGHTANISNSIFIGLRSGHNHTLSNRLIIWNQSVATEAIESANSIIYGVMASAAKDQSLTINASTFAVNGGADTDVTMNFTGTTNSGVYKWMEDEDYFEFSDDILVASAEKILLRDTAIGIYSQADTFMDLFADGGVRIGDSSAGAPTNYVEIESDGDVNFHGGAGLVFGSFYGNNIAFVTAGGTGTYSVVSDADIAAGQIHNTTFQNNQELDIGTYAGMYQVTWSMSVKGTGAGKHIVGAIGVDVGGVAGDVAQNPGRNHAITLGANEMCLAGTAILDLSADDEVSLMVTNETDNTNVTVEHVNLTIAQIGGT